MFGKVRTFPFQEKTVQAVLESSGAPKNGYDGMDEDGEPPPARSFAGSVPDTETVSEKGTKRRSPAIRVGRERFVRIRWEGVLMLLEMKS